MDKGKDLTRSIQAQLLLPKSVLMIIKNKNYTLIRRLPLEMVREKGKTVIKFKKDYKKNQSQKFNRKLVQKALNHSQ